LKNHKIPQGPQSLAGFIFSKRNQFHVVSQNPRRYQEFPSPFLGILRFLKVDTRILWAKYQEQTNGPFSAKAESHRQNAEKI